MSLPRTKMKSRELIEKLVFTGLIFLAAFNSWGGQYKRVKTSEELDKLPVIAWIKESDEEAQYRLYFRDIGILEGLAQVTIFINNEDKTTSAGLFFGTITLFDTDVQGVKCVEFVLQSDLIQRTSLEVITSKNRFAYRIPLSLLHQHFEKNKKSWLEEFDSDAEIDAFLKKNFDKEKGSQPTPNPTP